MRHGSRLRHGGRDHRGTFSVRQPRSGCGRVDVYLPRVTAGAVVVRDEVRHRNVLVRAGRSYLAKSRRALRLEHRRHR